MARNFRFDNKPANTRKRKEQGKVENDTYLSSEENVNEITEEEVIDVANEYERVSKEDSGSILEDEEYSTLSDKQTESISNIGNMGIIGNIDERTLLLIVLFVVLRSPKSDFSLILILLLLLLD